MRRGLAAALLCLLLTSCTWSRMMTAPAIESWRAEVMGLRVEYKLVESVNGHRGAASWWAGTCTIALAYHLSGTELVWVAAHEIGHCVDGAYLNWSHNGWTNEGCWYHEMYCPPREGYAEGYAEAYVEACGWARSPLGLLPGDGIECELPSPWSVTKPKGWYW
jgi:hypothetical protein